MAKEWAEPFYQSLKWKECRNSYFRNQHGLCERCNAGGKIVHHKTRLTIQNVSDPNITLNHNNLELLCHKCHDDEHNLHKLLKEHHRRKRIPRARAGTAFDEEGNLIEKRNVTIVWGAPASGKTRYVRDNKGDYDVVFDLDYILKALTMGSRHTEDAKLFAFPMRETFYRTVEKVKDNVDHIWIIACLPEKKERDKLAARLDAELIYMDADILTCKDRASDDPERENKAEQYEFINKHFNRLEF
jgi:5-methylcytosine-specific restriction protein A